jgi:CBS domain-containing protein
MWAAAPDGGFAMPTRTIMPHLVQQQDLAVIAGNATVRDAVRVMALRNIGSVLIMEDAVLQGIFTERDLLRRVVGRDLDPARTPVAEVMTVDPVTIGAGQSAAEAAVKMREGRFRHLPIVDADGAVVAVLSQRDFLSADVVEAERQIETTRSVWEVL